MPSSIGPWLVLVGVLIALAGLATWAGGLSWLGRLPGDLRFESGSTRIYLPLTSMLVVSLVLSLLLYLGRKLL